MAVWLDTKTLIDNIPAEELEYVRKVCVAGMDAALREGDMKAFFTFAIKEHAYKETVWYQSLYSEPRNGHKQRLPDWAERMIYPSDTDNNAELYARYLYRHPEPVYGMAMG